MSERMLPVLGHVVSETDLGSMYFGNLEYSDVTVSEDGLRAGTVQATIEMV